MFSSLRKRTAEHVVSQSIDAERRKNQKTKNKGVIVFNEKPGHFLVKAPKPSTLGPIHLPNGDEAINLKALMEGSLCYSNEINRNYFERRYSAFKGEKLSKMTSEPKAFVWIQSSVQDAFLLRYCTLQSKQFFCVYYARLVQQTDAFKQAKLLLNAGTNVAIEWKDGGEQQQPPTLDGLKQFVKDESKEFPAELIFYCLLTDQTPWSSLITFDF